MAVTSPALPLCPDALAKAIRRPKRWPTFAKPSRSIWKTAGRRVIQFPPKPARSSWKSRWRSEKRLAKLPMDLSGREVRAALERTGFVFRRQTGSHMVLRRDHPHARVVVPDHK